MKQIATESVTIETGLVIPAAERMGKRPNIYVEAFGRMNFGDSFLQPRKRLYTIKAAAKEAGVKVVTRKVGEDQVRVWKVQAAGPAVDPPVQTA